MTSKGAILALAFTGGAFALSEALACPVTPPEPVMTVPEAGRVWRQGDGERRACSPSQAPARQHQSGAEASLDAWLAGPEGSARFWLVRVDVVARDAPERGLCFITSTAGWRTMAGQWPAPIRFVEDQDADGAPELVLWSSLPLGEGGTNLETALIAWIYEFEEGVFRLDPALTRARAAALADAYRAPLGPGRTALSALRAAAADALDEMAADACWRAPRDDAQ